MGNSSHACSIPAAKCLCIGAANIDIRCAFENPGIGGSSNPATIRWMVGGAALNTARNVASADIACTFIGLVGNDDGGRLVADALQQAGVANGLVRQKNRPTSHYISMLEPDGSLNIAGNDMRIHEGLAPALIKPLLTPAILEDADGMFIDTNIPALTIEWLCNHVGGKQLFATSVSPAKAHRLLPVLSRLDVLFTNVAEAASLLGVAKTGAEELANILAASPVARGTLSDGKNPLWTWENGKIRRLEIPAHPQIKDVTGAGDGLAGGTIAALLHGAGFADAVVEGIDMAQKVLRVEGPYCGRF